jgi:hypothetical protein
LDQASKHCPFKPAQTCNLSEKHQFPIQWLILEILLASSGSSQSHAALMKSDMVAAAAREAARQSGLAMIHGKDDGGVAFFTSGDLFSDNVSFLPSPLLSLALGFDSFGDGTPLPLLFLRLWFECFGIELNPT